MLLVWIGGDSKQEIHCAPPPPVKFGRRYSCNRTPAETTVLSLLPPILDLLEIRHGTQHLTRPACSVTSASVTSASVTSASVTFSKLAPDFQTRLCPKRVIASKHAIQCFAKGFACLRRGKSRRKFLSTYVATQQARRPLRTLSETRVDPGGRTLILGLTSGKSPLQLVQSQNLVFVTFQRTRYSFQFARALIIDLDPPLDGACIRLGSAGGAGVSDRSRDPIRVRRSDRVVRIR